VLAAITVPIRRLIATGLATNLKACFMFMLLFLKSIFLLCISSIFRLIDEICQRIKSGFISVNKLFFLAITGKNQVKSGGVNSK
jgi:hypothetical protein